jgi:hypothetical protein
MPIKRFRSDLWSRRFKNYIECAIMLFVGYQLAWHKDSLGGHPGRALLALGALVFGIAILVAALKTTNHKYVNVHRAWIVAGFVVVALATAYGTSVVHGVKWSSLWVVFAVLVLLIVTEVAIRDHVLKSIKKHQLGAKLPRFIPRLKIVRAPSSAPTAATDPQPPVRQIGAGAPRKARRTS